MLQISQRKNTENGWKTRSFAHNFPPSNRIVFGQQNISHTSARKVHMQSFIKILRFKSKIAVFYRLTERYIVRHAKVELGIGTLPGLALNNVGRFPWPPSGGKGTITRKAVMTLYRYAMRRNSQNNDHQLFCIVQNLQKTAFFHLQ